MGQNAPTDVKKICHVGNLFKSRAFCAKPLGLTDVVMLRFWFFHLDSISIRFFTKNSMSVRFRFRFFRQEISYTSPINLGAAMLNYSGEAVDDSERSTTVARLYTRVHM